MAPQPPLSSDDLPRVLASGESQAMEFRDAPGAPATMAALVAAFANAAAGGTILYGVDEADGARAVGTDPAEVRRTLARAIDGLTPRPSVEVAELQTEGAVVVALTVPPSDEGPVVLTDGRVPVRVGEETVYAGTPERMRDADRRDLDRIFRQRLDAIDAGSQRAAETLAASFETIQASNLGLRQELERLVGLVKELRQEAKAERDLADEARGTVAELNRRLAEAERPAARMRQTALGLLLGVVGSVLASALYARFVAGP